MTTMIVRQHPVDLPNESFTVPPMMMIPMIVTNLEYREVVDILAVRMMRLMIIVVTVITIRRQQLSFNGIVDSLPRLNPSFSMNP